MKFSRTKISWCTTSVRSALCKCIITMHQNLRVIIILSFRALLRRDLQFPTLVKQAEIKLISWRQHRSRAVAHGLVTCRCGLRSFLPLTAVVNSPSINLVISCFCLCAFNGLKMYYIFVLRLFYVPHRSRRVYGTKPHWLLWNCCAYTGIPSHD